MLLDQNHQSNVSAITPMPTDRVDDTSVVNTSSAETVVWYYSNSGVWAAAATQAAGTICVAKLTYSGVLNSNGSAIGRKKDTSLSWGAATRVSTLVEIPEEEFSKMLDMTVAEKVAYVTRTGWLDTNGDYAIDHRRGEVWMKSKATVANDAATYKYATPLTGGGTGDKVDLIKIGGVSVIADDGVFTAGTSTGIVAFGFADETSTDSVNEGDCGALRMTLNRRLITADLYQEDTAHTTADYGSQVFAVRTDTQAALAGTTGDYTPLQTDAYGALRVVGGASSTSAQYRATSTGRGDGTCVYASASTLTVAGTSFTLASEDLVYVREVDATGNTATLWVNGSGGVELEISSGTLTKTGGSDFSANGVYELGYNGQDKAYDASNTANRSEIINRKGDTLADDDLVDTTNVTAATHYYPSSTGLTMDGYRDYSLSGKFIDADGTLTLTIEGMNDEDTTSGDWIQLYAYDDKNDIVTNSWTITNSTLTFAISLNNCNYRYLRFAVVASGGTNTVILKGRRKEI